MLQYTLEEATARLPESVEAAANGEQIFIIKGDNQLLQLVPVPREPEQPTEPRQRQLDDLKGLIWMADDFDAPLDLKPAQSDERVFGSAKGLIILADDFDAPLEDFKEYQ